MYEDLRERVKQGDSEALVELGIELLFGSEEDFEEAMLLLERGSRQEVRDALVQLGLYYTRLGFRKGVAEKAGSSENYCGGL